MRLFLSNKRFEEAARKHLYSAQSKPKDKEFAKMSLAFVDSNGVKYYKYDDPMDMPLKRKGKYDEYLKWLSRGLSGEQQIMFLDAMDAAVDECINSMDKGGRIKNIGKTKALTDEMRRREKLIVHEEIYFRIMSVSYVREDENPAVWDGTIETQKIDQFKQDSAGGLHDFFMDGPLAQHIAGCELSVDELTDCMNESRLLAVGTTKWIRMLMSEEK